MPNNKSDLIFIGTNGNAVKSGQVLPSGVTVNTNFTTAPQTPGVAFMGTAGDGLIIQTTSTSNVVTFQAKTTADGLGSNFISSIFVDFDRTIWAGTYHPDDFNQGGLSVSRDFGQTWETFRVNGVYDPLLRNRNPKITGMPSNNIRDIKRDRLTNKLVIATDDGVISTLVTANNILPLIIENSQIINDTVDFAAFSTLNGLGSNNVKTILVEEVPVKTVTATEPTIRTIWWAGTASGLSKSVDQGTTWKTFDLTSNLVDVEGPALSFVTPNNNDTVSGILPIALSATDATSIKSVEISFDNVTFSAISFNGTNYVVSKDTRTLTNGKTFLYARATDTFGNVSQAIPLILNVNNALPASLLVIDIDEPRENSTISDIFDLKLEVISDVAIARVEITTDPIPPQTFLPATLSIAPRLVEGSLTLLQSFYTFPFDTTSLASGSSVTLTARVTDENGIAATSVRHFKIFNRLPNVQSIAVAGHVILAGTTNQCGATLSLDNGRTWKFFTTADGLSSNNVQAVAMRANELWVGTDNGLNFSPNMGQDWQRLTVTGDNLPGNDIRFITFQGSITWVGTTNGVGKLSNVGFPFVVYRTPDISSNQVNHIFVDCDQISVWLSTQNGISLTKNGGTTWRIIRNVDSGLPTNIVQAVTRYKNRIYAATTNGIGISSDGGKSFIRLGTTAIADNLVLSFRVDGADLWIGTFRGLTKLDGNGRFVTYKREGVFSAIGQQLSSTNIGLKSNIINYIAQ